MVAPFAAADVPVSFDGLRALSNVTLKVPRGRVTGLIGPNGAGRAPLLKVIAEAGERGLILLSCGARANVVRLLPPLTIEGSVLDQGLVIFEAAIDAPLSNHATDAAWGRGDDQRSWALSLPFPTVLTREPR
jgi:ATPase subunit of ABC transporter with duplicated ATPase domains